MKRALLENNRVIINPGIVDRNMFLSAIFAIKVEEEITEGTVASIKFEHCDTEDGEFEAVTDTELCLGARIDPKTGTLSNVAVKSGEDVNIDLDLVGCKRFVKITVSLEGADSASVQTAPDGTDNASIQTAIVLGDSSEVPV